MRLSLTPLGKALIALSAVLISRAAVALLPASYDLSTETYPVDFTINTVHLKIPRNYLVYGTGQYPVLWVNFPGTQPFTADQSACHTRDWPIDIPGKCKPVVAEILESHAKPADEFLQEVLAREHIQGPHPGPAGFEKYELRSDLAYYRGIIDGRSLLYSCTKPGWSDQILCDPYANTLAPGVDIIRTYPEFSVDRLAEAVEVDTQLYKLGKGFVIHQ